MLDRIRKGKGNFLFLFVIFAVCAVMAFVGIGNMGGGSQNEDDQTWAYVNGDKVTSSEVRMELQRRIQLFRQILGGKNFDERMFQTPQYINASVDSVIQTKLLAQTAREMGMLVPDLELLRVMKQSYIAANGKWDPKRYRSIPNRGVIESQERTRLNAQRLRQYFMERVKLSPSEIRQSYLVGKTQVEFEFAKIDFASLSEKHNPTKKELQFFYDEKDQKSIQDYYKANIDKYTDRGAVTFRQLRQGIAFSASDEKRAEVRQKIEALKKDITPENFEEMARKNSDDEYAQKGGSRGEVSPTAIEPSLASALASLKPGEVSQPVETPFGYYLLLLEKKKEDRVKPIEEVKTDIAKILAKDKYAKEFEVSRTEKWNRTLAGGRSIENELKSLKIKIEKAGPIALDSRSIPKIQGDADPIFDELLKLKTQNAVVPKLLEVGDNIYFVRLRKLTVPSEKDFPKEATTVANSLQRNLQAQVISQWISHLESNATIKKVQQLN